MQKDLLPRFKKHLGRRCWRCLYLKALYQKAGVLMNDTVDIFVVALGAGGREAQLFLN